MGFSRQEYWSGVPLPSLEIKHSPPIILNSFLTFHCGVWLSLNASYTGSNRVISPSFFWINGNETKYIEFNSWKSLFSFIILLLVVTLAYLKSGCISEHGSYGNVALICPTAGSITDLQSQLLVSECAHTFMPRSCCDLFLASDWTWQGYAGRAVSVTCKWLIKT